MLWALQSNEQKGLVQVGRTAFCTSTPNLAPNEALGVILRYADLHPEKKGELFLLFAINALRDAWPCKK
jgi:hypothetical protein